MADVTALAEVRLWGRRVGAVAERDGRSVVFEYDPEFRRSGLEISPVRLPLERAGPMDFPELQRKPAFDGLPGVLADALPDAFGNRVIRAYFMARGQEDRALSPVQRLLYVGERALGALTFHPAEDLPARPAEEQALQVAALVADARRILQGRPGVTVPEIYRVGASAGGMRPKALVLHDPARGTLRSGFAEPQPGEVPCLLKFDGVGADTGPEALGAPQPFNRIETAYARVARTAGIDMASVDILRGAEPYAHLLIRRFDIEDGRRLHQHTLGGLLHVDYNDVGASSYEEFLRSALRLGMPPAAVEEGFRRTVFNIVAVNQDDHVKNLSFHLTPDGHWRLAPAYDLTFSRGAGWTATHQMRVADKLSHVTWNDLLGVARTFGVKRPERVLEQVRTSLATWPEEAAAAGVASEHVERVQAELDARAREMGID